MKQIYDKEDSYMCKIKFFISIIMKLAFMEFTKYDHFVAWGQGMAVELWSLGVNFVVENRGIDNISI